VAYILQENASQSILNKFCTSGYVGYVTGDFWWRT